VSEERGSALILVPAGVLVLIILAAIAIDFSLVFLAQRELTDATTAAANDAAAAAIRPSTFYGSGQLTLDPDAAARIACDSVRGQAASGLDITDVRIETGDRSVRVTAQATVRAVFLRAVPGATTHSVHATSSAVARQSVTDAALAPSTVATNAVSC
jgi:Flp pilus assembly protein TadG